MGSMGAEVVKRRKAMWLYPKVVGFNPPERWGHSACFCDGVVYVYGGCCGGLHFSDVLTLNLDTMTWTTLATTGQKPGSRDSHCAVIIGYKMLILGGTNGLKKVNDLHILDLTTKEWTKPKCKGVPPSPRESLTATLVGDEKLVIFGGSGEGEANYLNDVHVLDLKSMTWTSPDVKGGPPAPRDSHTAVVIGNKILIYGGDCGDRYHGEVDVLDVDTLSWSRLEVRGSSPGVRAGHAAVSIGNKVYIIGGVGDKQYYSDVWVLDVAICTWTQLDTRGQQPQGRFSHTAVVTNTDIAIYGGCGEDERPLNELLILQLGSEHPNGRYNISMCKIFGKHCHQEKRKFLRGSDNLQKSVVLKNGDRGTESEPMNPLFRSTDILNRKRRRFSDPRAWEIEFEQEEHSLSLSQHSSPSQSDQEQNAVMKSASESIRLRLNHQEREQANVTQKTTQNVTQRIVADQKPQLRPAFHPFIGAEVFGTVDGAFDSGYLMTANVNGQILRGVLFAPGPGVAMSRPRPALHSQGPTGPTAVTNRSVAHASMPIHARPPQATAFMMGPRTRQSQPVQIDKAHSGQLDGDLQGVVLTLGGPGGGDRVGVERTG